MIFRPCWFRRSAHGADASPVHLQPRRRHQRIACALTNTEPLFRFARACGRAARRHQLILLVLLTGASCQRVESPSSSQLQPEIVTTATGFEMVRIPAGEFDMGSNKGRPDEAPVHRVYVDSFLIDRREVNQEQYARLAQRSPQLVRDPAHFKGADRPVEMVSWGNAALFCNERSRAEGLQPCYDEETAACNFDANGYRLPTEAEWEYACRAGSSADYFFGSDPRMLGRYAWYKDNASDRTHPVGKKKPNSWGLYDMLGNVAEWCNDIYAADTYAGGPSQNPRGPANGDKYVLRGGAWNRSPDACRAGYRIGEDPGFQDACFARDAIGFRCVRKAAKRGQDSLMHNKES